MHSPKYTRQADALLVAQLPNPMPKTSIRSGTLATREMMAVQLGGIGCSAVDMGWVVYCAHVAAVRVFRLSNDAIVLL